MYIYICMHTYIYIYIYTHIYIYTYIYIYVYMYNIYIYTHLSLSLYIYIYITPPGCGLESSSSEACFLLLHGRAIITPRCRHRYYYRESSLQSHFTSAIIEQFHHRAVGQLQSDLIIQQLSGAASAVHVSVGTRRDDSRCQDLGFSV